MDDVALAATDGGGAAYKNFGIGSEGCIAIVRPDGHVAAIAPLGEVGILKQFFEGTRNGSWAKYNYP